MKTFNRITIALLVAVLQYAGVEKAAATIDPEIQGEYNCLAEGDNGTYDFVKVWIGAIGGFINDSQETCPVKVKGRTFSITGDGMTIHLKPSGVGYDYEGTLTRDADGKVRKCLVYRSVQTSKKIWADEIERRLSAGDLTRAYIYLNNYDTKTRVAVPITARFVKSDWVSTQYSPCGLLSITSDSPMMKTLGDLSCAYYYNPGKLNIILSDGTDKIIELNDNAQAQTGLLTFSFGKKIVEGLGEVNVDLRIYF